MRLDRATPGEGKPLGRMKPVERHGLFTAMNWYGDYPHQIAGDPAGATAEYGNDILDANAANLAAAIRAIRRDETGLRLLAGFYDAADRPGDRKHRSLAARRRRQR